LAFLLATRWNPFERRTLADRKLPLMTAMNRRRFLRNAAAATAGVAIAPRVLGWRATAVASTLSPAAPADPLLPFIEHYQTNVSTDLSFSSNAAVEILSGFSQLWQTGAAWNNGTVLDAGALYANMLHSVWVTTKRTEDEAKESFIVDRQDQSYDMIGALGPLARYYYAGSLAVTSITSAPDGTPATQINDVVPAGAAAGSMTGAGNPASALGALVTLVTTLRGNYSSGNPSKNTFQYPRPWRMNDESQVIDTGTVDPYGFPVYESDVVVAPQLLLQRSLTPASDGAFPSGHTNAFYLAGLAYAYAVPERFQEIITRAMELANYRIVAGMHSSVDVLGGRILGTALAAAILADPANGEVKVNARATALAYFESATGSADLFAAAHAAGLDADPYSSRELNERLIQPWWTYVLPRRGLPNVPMTVPAGAEVLLETRQPYLAADQRREVLRTTALPSGYPLLDGGELWGRLNLFAAADGYGAFAADVTVVMDATAAGFNAADAWKNDISGPGGLVKQGSGALTLSGENSFRGGTVITGGTLVAAAPNALGSGPVQVGAAGTLAVTPVQGGQGAGRHGAGVEVDGTLEVAGILAVTLGAGPSGPVLSVAGTALLDAASSLVISLPDGFSGRAAVPLLSARQVRGTFGAVSVATPGYRAAVRYARDGVTVVVSKA
jgi:autotransporter-associated beta strand protein